MITSQAKQEQHEARRDGFNTLKTHKHTPEQHKGLEHQSQACVFIMWRASCFPITPPLFFVH